MSEQIFNTVFERGCRAGAAHTGPAHMQRHHTVSVAVKNNIAAILRHGGAHPRVEQLFDRTDNFRIRPGFVFLPGGFGICCMHDRQTGNKMIHNGRQNRRFDMLPFGIVFGDGDEIGTEKHARHMLQRKQRTGQRRGFGGLGIGKVVEAFARPSRPARHEFQGRRIVASVWINMSVSFGLLVAII